MALCREPFRSCVTHQPVGHVPPQDPIMHKSIKTAERQKVCEKTVALQAFRQAQEGA